MRPLDLASRMAKVLPTAPSLAAGAVWAVAWALAWAGGAFGFLEEPLGDVLWRASQSNEPTTSTWIVFADAESRKRGWSPDAPATWTVLLQRAREEAVVHVVVLDPRA